MCCCPRAGQKRGARRLCRRTRARPVASRRIRATARILLHLHARSRSRPLPPSLALPRVPRVVPRPFARSGVSLLRAIPMGRLAKAGTAARPASRCATPPSLPPVSTPSPSTPPLSSSPRPLALHPRETSHQRQRDGVGSDGQANRPPATRVFVTAGHEDRVPAPGRVPAPSAGPPRSKVILAHDPRPYDPRTLAHTTHQRIAPPRRTPSPSRRRRRRSCARSTATGP